MKENMFDSIDFGPLKEYISQDDITDISYDNGGQIHLKTLSKGIYRVENPNINDAFMEKLAFQCSNVMGTTFNMAHPFLDAESAELRLNFVHNSIATNGIACVIRKTPAKIRLQKDKIIAEKYVEPDIHELLVYCVKGHCNILASGETGSGKTEFIKYLASKIAEDEKIITIEDTLELHLDRIFPHRDIVSMKTNNIASYTDVLVTCMRQNPKWILLSEVRSAEAVLAVRNSISSGHYILSTIHADKAAAIPQRLYSLLETNQDIDQFVAMIHRYVQIGVYVRGYTDKATHKFVREIGEVTEFYVDENNQAKHNTIYRKTQDGKVIRNNPSKYLIDYLEVQGVYLPEELLHLGENIPLKPGQVQKKPMTEIPDITNTVEQSHNTQPINNQIQNQQMINTQPNIQTNQTPQMIQTNPVMNNQQFQTNNQLINRQIPQNMQNQIPNNE